MVNRSVASVNPCLVTDLEKKAFILPLSVRLAVGFFVVVDAFVFILFELYLPCVS